MVSEGRSDVLTIKLKCSLTYELCTFESFSFPIISSETFATIRFFASLFRGAIFIFCFEIITGILRLRYCCSCPWRSCPWRSWRSCPWRSCPWASVSLTALLCFLLINIGQQVLDFSQQVLGIIQKRCSCPWRSCPWRSCPWRSCSRSSCS